jgi:hypothetical protein
VYKNTLVIIKHQIPPVENPIPAVLITVKAAGVDNAILLDYLSSEVALEEPEIGRTDPNILIDNSCMDDKMHFGMPGGSGVYEDECDENDQHDPIPTASKQRRAVTLLKRFDVGMSEVDGYEGGMVMTQMRIVRK